MRATANSALVGRKTVRSAAIAAVGLLVAFAVGPAAAAVPPPVLALFAPSIGYQLSQSDLCQWDMANKIRSTFDKSFKDLGMTIAQMATVWEQATARRESLASLPAQAKARMKVDTCTAESRARLEHDLAD